MLSGICIDSRRARRGDLFVALPGERADGHDFVADAAGHGAVAAMVTAPARAASEIVVDHCETALAQIATQWRGQFGGRVVAVTGSNGKTTVKEMLASIFRATGKPAYRSSGNMNNRIGLSLSVLGLRPQHQFAVLEAGMDAPGELRELGGICRPQAAVINNAQRAHLGGFASVAEIARAKGELIETLPADGTAVLNADDPHLSLWQKLAGKRRALTFGFGKNADYRGEVSAGGLRLPGLDKPVKLRLPGAHNIANGLAAAAAASALKIPPAVIAAGLESCEGAPRRLQFKKTPAGVILIDDTYNANPDSLAAALAVLGGCAGEKFAVLGDMLALGDAAAAEHLTAAKAARAAGAHLLTVGEHMQAANPDGHFRDKESLARELQKRLARCKTAAVLVKGSRGMRMETLADMLEGGA